MRGAAWVVVLGWFALHSAVAAAAAPPDSTGARRFDRGAWEADFAALESALERSYSHLAWFGAPESGVDLPALHAAARGALARAASDAEASAAITTFVAGFRDGHFGPTARPAAPDSASEPPLADAMADARTACAAYGYAPVTRLAFSLPFETLPGFELTADGLSDAFRAGVIDVDGRRFGLVRIPRFRPAEYPSLCERAWAALRARNVMPTRAAIEGVIDAEWLRTLATRLREFRARAVSLVVVDVGGNGGGNDLGDWAVRLFSSAPVHSAPLLLSAGAVAVPYFDEQLASLRAATPSPARLPGPTRAALQKAIAAFERRKREADAAPCDMSWVWRERRP